MEQPDPTLDPPLVGLDAASCPSGSDGEDDLTTASRAIGAPTFAPCPVSISAVLTVRCVETAQCRSFPPDGRQEIEPLCATRIGVEVRPPERNGRC
jgi:hypothetical protein